MPDAHFYTAAASASVWIDAGVALLVAAVIAKLVDYAIAKRGQTVGELVVGGELSPATRTRLRRPYDIAPLGDVVVKGKTKPVAIFQIRVPSPLPTAAPEAANL